MVFIVYEGFDLAAATLFAFYERGDYVLAIGGGLFAFANFVTAVAFIYHKLRFHHQVGCYHCCFIPIYFELFFFVLFCFVVNASSFVSLLV
jgi:hypothetical protein